MEKQRRNKTKKAIQLAFVKLLTEKNLDEITVKEIAEQAKINRKTFYNHYPNVFELVDEIENEISFAFEFMISDIDLEEMSNDPTILFTKITYFINQDIEFYTHLVNNNTHSRLSIKLTQAFKNTIHSFLNEHYDIDPIQLNIITDYIIGGVLSVYTTWFNHQDDLSLEDTCNIVNKLLFHGLNDILKEESD